MRSAYLLAMLCATTVAVPVSGADSPFVHYRGVTLGDSVETVVDRLKATPADVRTLQERPTPVRELTWRPAYRSGSSVRIEPDSMAEMVLTFHLNRLARITVTYDGDRIRGMTDVDLRDALIGVYGIAMLVSRPTEASVLSPAAPEPIGRWGDAQTRVLLWREARPDRVKLTITAIGANRAMEAALTDGARLEAAEAPARDLVRQVVEAAAAEAREQSARRENKAAFKP
jgi:hypothetical protein